MNEQDPMVQAILRKLMSQQQPGPYDALEMEAGAADAMGPEGMAQLYGSNTLGKRSALGKDVYGQEAGMHQGDLAQAQKLQGQRFGNSGSATGNVLGGLGDVLNSVRGGMMERDARAGMKDSLGRYQQGQEGFLGKEDAINARFGGAHEQAIKNFLAKRQQAQQSQQEVPYYLAKP